MSWTIDKFMQLATGYWPASVISAAVQLGLFDVLEGKGATASEASSRMGTSHAHTTELLDALTALDVLDKWADIAQTPTKEHVYKIKPSAAQFLTRSGAWCIIDAL
ncbi:MAG: methyltransferase dimerization domain-containing protein, partial [bacterium]